jgi:hypothetical protein
MQKMAKLKNVVHAKLQQFDPDIRMRRVPALLCIDSASDWLDGSSGASRRAGIIDEGSL